MAEAQQGRGTDSVPAGHLGPGCTGTQSVREEAKETRGAEKTGLERGLSSPQCGGQGLHLWHAGPAPVPAGLMEDGEKAPCHKAP